MGYYKSSTIIRISIISCKAVIRSLAAIVEDSAFLARQKFRKVSIISVLQSVAGYNLYLLSERCHSSLSSACRIWRRQLSHLLVSDFFIKLVRAARLLYIDHRDKVSSPSLLFHLIQPCKFAKWLHLVSTNSTCDFER